MLRGQEIIDTIREYREHYDCSVRQAIRHYREDLEEELKKLDRFVEGLKVPTCTNCGQPLTNVFSARSVELQQPAGDVWIEKNVFSSGCSCPHCHTELTVEQMHELGIPPEYR